MISYKTYKLITESTFTLGLKSRPSLGIVGSKFQEMGFEKDDNPEMMGDNEMGDYPPEEPSDEMGMDQLGDDEMDGDESGMEGESQPCPACNHDGAKDEEECVNDPDCQACEACDGTGWLPPEGGEEGMDDEMGGDMDGEEGMGDEMGGDPMMGGDDMGGEEGMGSNQIHQSPGESPMMGRSKKPMFSRKFMNKKHMGSSCNYMQREEAVSDDFISSLTRQTKGDNNPHYKSGLAEEILIAMGEPTKRPGEVGFAPQQAIGGELGGGFSMDDFKELPILGQ